MPLTIEAQKKALKALKYSDADIAKLTGDGENDTEISAELKVFDAAEYTQLTTNLSKGVNDTSRKAGIELTLKKIKAKTGIEMEVTPDTDIDAFADAVKTHIITDAKIEPNAAKTQWEKEKKELQDKLIAEQKRIEAIEGEKETISYETAILKALPTGESPFSKDDIVLLVKNKMQRKKDGDTEYFEYDGKRLQDKVNSDLKLSDAVKHVVNEGKWITETQAGDDKRGRGVGSDKGGAGSIKPTKSSEARSAWEKNDGGINPDGFGVNTAQYQAYQTSLAKENKETWVSD